MVKFAIKDWVITLTNNCYYIYKESIVAVVNKLDYIYLFDCFFLLYICHYIFHSLTHYRYYFIVSITFVVDFGYIYGEY